MSDRKSDVPFSTTEPENFQAEIMITTGETERKIFIARRGERRRIDYDFGQPNQHSVLETDKRYIISSPQKIYAEIPGSVSGTAANPLIEQLLNLRNYATFEYLGAENNAEKYRAKLGGSEAAEILIYVDVAAGIPIKQEFYSINGDERELQYTFEMLGLKLETDDAFFQIPAGFRAVPFDEFYRIFRARK